MKQLVFILMAFFLVGSPLYAAMPLSLDEAVESALKNHPQVIEAEANLRGAEARTGQAQANYYPQINFSADWNRTRSYLPVQESIRTTEVGVAAVYLKQTIFDFGRTAGSVEAARSNLAAADQARTVSRHDVILRVKSAFYLLFAAEKQVVAVAETVKARSMVLNQAQEFFRQGIRSKVDVTQAEANFFAAKTALIRAENNRDIARLELANAMGNESLDEYSPVEPVFVPVTLPEKGQIQQLALRNRAELQQLAALKSTASANLKTARGSYLPILSGTANVGAADGDITPSGNVWGVGLNLTMPLFSGFSSVEQVREAAAAINAIEARQSNVRLQISKEVESARLGVDEASARMISTDKEVTATGENMSLAEGRYQEGVGTIVEVTDAHVRALEARTARIQAMYDYYIALARLERSVGSSEKQFVKE